MQEIDGGWTLGAHTAGDGYRCSYRRYGPTGLERARVVCVHGIQSHAGWYGHSCRRWAAAGYDVFFLDRRGSGLNSTARGDTPSFRRLLDDVGEFLHDLRNKAGLPLILVGISWGAKIAVGLARRHPGLLDG